MNQDFKQKWIDALVSRDYEQGTEFLRRDDKYCCLGVLCNIVDPTKWGTKDEDGVFNYKLFTFETNSTLPPEVADLVQVDSKTQEILYHRNDGLTSDVNIESKKWSFIEIAKWIEENL